MQTVEQTSDGDRASSRMSMISTATTVVENLNKADLVEIKAYAAPPQGVKDVLTATLILLGCPKSEQTWAGAKKELGKHGATSLTKQVAELDVEKIPIESRREAMKYLSKYSFEDIRNKSAATAGFYSWAIAVASE